jgi:hypothetical protein
MIPQLVTVRYRRPGGRWLRLYIPVVPVLLVLSPLLLLATLAGLIACLVLRVSSVEALRGMQVSPVGALRGFGGLLWALPGSQLELEDGQTAFLIRVR